MIKTLLTILVILLVALAPTLEMLAQELYFYPRTYVENIDTPSYGNKTETILKDFSSLQDDKIIAFTPIDYGRTIQIKEMDDSLFYSVLIPDAIGLAEPGLFNCKIYLKKGLSNAIYRETVIHEYLHCMGYMHVNDEFDIMYYSVTPFNKERNIRDYARDLRERYYDK